MKKQNRLIENFKNQKLDLNSVSKVGGTIFTWHMDISDVVSNGSNIVAYITADARRVGIYYKQSDDETGC